MGYVMGRRFHALFLLILIAALVFIGCTAETGRNKQNKEAVSNKAGQEGSAGQTDSAGLTDNEADTEATAYKDTVQYDTLFDHSKLHRFKIVMTREEWDGLSKDMLEYQSVDDRMRTGNYRKADLYYTDENGDYKINEIGIRTKGNTSRVLPEDSEGFHRFNFKLKFNETFDLTEDTEVYEERDDRTFAGLSELNFKANDGADPTNIREIFSYDLISDYGVYTAKASLAALTIVVDGVEHNYGVVKYIEPVDKDFLTKRFGKEMNDGNLYKCLWQNYGPAALMPIDREIAVGIKDWTKNYRPTYDLKTNKKEKNYQDLKDFIDNINSLNGNDLKAYLEEHFEIDRFLKSQALDVVLGNIDGYRSMGNNYYLYFNENGKAEWIPYDYDNILGAGWYADDLWSYEGIATADIYEWNNLNAAMYDQDTTHPLIDKMFEIEEYRKAYEDYLQELIDPKNNYFTYSRFLELYHQLFQLYGSSIENEMQEGNVWQLSNEEWYFETKINSLKQQLGQ